jgi:hypothetical protein
MQNPTIRPLFSEIQTLHLSGSAMRRVTLLNPEPSPF